MIEYIQSHNPDDRTLKKASGLLSQSELICIPTDTNWVLVACSENKEAIEKLYRIKKENKKKHFSLLCQDISMASELAIIDNQAFKTLKKMIPGHYTFIFEATKKIAKLIQASKTDKEIGIRFVPSTLISKLIETHGKALVSTNIPHSLLELNEDSTEEIYSYMIEEKIGHLLQLIIDPGEIQFSGQSSIVSFVGETAPTILRAGAGDLSFFE